jgi:hypothetical protein
MSIEFNDDKPLQREPAPARTLDLFQYPGLIEEIAACAAFDGASRAKGKGVVGWSRRRELKGETSDAQ